MVDETMANAARVHSVEQGHQTENKTLIAFGGAAPLHVSRIAEKLKVKLSYLLMQVLDQQ